MAGDPAGRWPVVSDDDARLRGARSTSVIVDEIAAYFTALDEQFRAFGEACAGVLRDVAACAPDAVEVEPPPMLAALAAKRAGRGAGPAAGRLDGRGGRR